MSLNRNATTLKSYARLERESFDRELRYIDGWGEGKIKKKKNRSNRNPYFTSRDLSQEWLDQWEARPFNAVTNREEHNYAVCMNCWEPVYAQRNWNYDAGDVALCDRTWYHLISTRERCFATAMMVAFPMPGLLVMEEIDL